MNVTAAPANGGPAGLTCSLLAALTGRDAASAARLLGRDANTPVRSFTACCQTVTAACGEFVPRGEW